MEHKCTAVFEPNDNGWWTAYVPTLPGCISQGEALDEAKANIREAMELWIESVTARGMKLPAADIEFAEIKVEL